MPFLTRPCGARLYYSVKGRGIPVLLLAPGGMRSCVANWAAQPYDPLERLPHDRFQLIAMDQRTAMLDGGRSEATIRASDGWSTFRDDQLALLDHLGVRRCLTLGSCIGPSFQLQLMRDAPERFGAAVMLQPIGLCAHTTEPGPPWDGLNEEATVHWFGHWAREVERRGLASGDVLRSVYDNLFGGRDFVFSVSRDDVLRVEAPMLLLMGRDLFHPSDIARELARLAPAASLVEEWRDAEPSALEAAAARVEAFLLEHAHLATDRADAAREGAAPLAPLGAPLTMARLAELRLDEMAEDVPLSESMLDWTEAQARQFFASGGRG